MDVFKVPVGRIKNSNPSQGTPGLDIAGPSVVARTVRMGLRLQGACIKCFKQCHGRSIDVVAIRVSNIKSLGI